MHSDAQHALEQRIPTALVVGAGGFIGGHVVAALRRKGWRVVLAVRGKGHALGMDERECDLLRMRSAEDWLPLLTDIDAVVNVAGILRETGSQTFEAVHMTAPLALAKACMQNGGTRFVQVSALGLPSDGDFIASKHRFDEALLALPLSAVVLRPSVVYSVAGSYGGTSLLRALAAFPAMQLLPGDGRWQVQPLAAEDLGELVAIAAGSTITGVYEVGGPSPVSLREYQRQWREWLRIPGDRAFETPVWCVSLTVRVMEWLGRGPVGETMWRMLRRGNVTAADAGERLQTTFGLRTRSLQEALATSPSQVQDRWQAQLYFLAPTLRVAVIALWLISAFAGFTTSATAIEQMAANSWLQHAMPVVLARAAGSIDLLLAIWLLSGWRPRTAIASMIVLVGLYTLAFGVALPALWQDPLGGLAKNLVVLPALAMLWVLSDRR